MPAKPVVLTKAIVLEKARAAYLAKRLSAQGPTPACMYRDASGRPCVIGAALPARAARRFDGLREGGVNIRCLSDDGLISTDDLGFMDKLQSAHDDWAQTRPGSAANVKAEARLRNLLGLSDKAA